MVGHDALRPRPGQPGLVAAHTPGTWPLGDIQEWVAASLLGDTGRAERALVRLLAVAAPDGLLPEAYDSRTGRWLARPWFAWPGAALAALALGAWTTGLGEASGG